MTPGLLVGYGAKKGIFENSFSGLVVCAYRADENCDGDDLYPSVMELQGSSAILLLLWDSNSSSIFSFALLTNEGYTIEVLSSDGMFFGEEHSIASAIIFSLWKPDPLLRLSILQTKIKCMKQLGK